jgi:hypothetical protein
MPIDILSGSSRLRESNDANQTSPADAQRLAKLDVDDWLQGSRSFRRYG